MILASALFTVACQDKGLEKPEDKPVVPSTSTLSQIKDIADIAAAGDATQILSFKADSSWSASSDKTWCALSVKSGASGDASITLTVEPNPFFEARQALITFVEGVGSRSINKIVKVSQLPLERKITVTDIDGAPLTKAILVPNDESGMAEYKVRVKVTANFPWYVSETPIWMPGLDVKGDAGQEVAMWLSVDPAKLETSSQVGSVKYHDQGSLFIHNLDVEFAGVGNVYLKYDLPGILNFGKDNSAGSMTQRFFNVVTSETYTSAETAPFSIITTEVKPDPTGGDNHVWNKDAFNVEWLSIYYNRSLTRSLVSTVPWYIGAVDNVGDVRSAAVLIIPKSSVPKDLNDMFNDIEGVWTLKEEFAKYHATTIVQQAAALAFTGSENYDIDIPVEGISTDLSAEPPVKPLVIKALNGIYSAGLEFGDVSALLEAGWALEGQSQWATPMTHFIFSTIPANTSGAAKETIVEIVARNYDNFPDVVVTPLGTITFKQPAI